MKNNIFIITFIVLMTLLVAAAIVKVSTSRQVSVEPKCNDGITRDVTEDGTPRVTYIPANDTCEK